MQTEYRHDDGAMLRASCDAIATRVRNGEWRAVDVVDAHIARVQAANPQINAVVAERFDAARAEAGDLDACSSADRQSLALAGVPFTVKELIEVSGMPLTFGSLTRLGRRGEADATVVARLRAAGAIPLGVTNVPEWGMWFESYNRVYGRTSNPHDPDHTPGGSSGGEGAIVGAGGAAFGVGSDIGGSARMPAAFCGVYGHKPTTGLLPLTGHYPVYRAGPDAALLRRAPYVTIGPLARSARDLMLLLRVMAGPDDIDPNAQRLALGDAAHVSWRDRQVVLLPAPRIAWTRRTTRELQECVQRAGTLLARRGARIDEAPADLFRRAGDLWFAALQSVGGPSFSEIVGRGQPVHLIRNIVGATFGRGVYSWPALFFLIGERIGRRGRRRLEAALAELRRVMAHFAQLIGDDGVLVMPVHPRPAPRHNEPVLHPFDFLYTAVFNALRVPVTVAPTGMGESGLPLAVQIASIRGNDHVTIAAAHVLEDHYGPWQPAPVVARDDARHR